MRAKQIYSRVVGFLGASLLSLLFAVSGAGELVVAQTSGEVNLAGYKQVPPVQSSGSGLIQVELRSDTLFVEGNFGDLTGIYRSSGIYYGRERESGNRLHGLRAEVDEDRRGGYYSVEENYFILRPSILEALRDGLLYINITTDRHRRGEIRGQLPRLQK